MGRETLARLLFAMLTTYDGITVAASISFSVWPSDQLIVFPDHG